RRARPHRSPRGWHDHGAPPPDASRRGPPVPPREHLDRPRSPSARELPIPTCARRGGLEGPAGPGGGARPRMILRGIVPTPGDGGSVNISPMGPLVADDFRRLTLRPFQTSRTFRSLK